MDLGAFGRGVLGPGLIDYTNQQAALAKEARDRAETERLYAIRYGMASGGPGGASGARGARGVLAADPAAEDADRRQQAVWTVMRTQRVAQPEAERLVDGVLSGRNDLMRDVTKTESFGDGDNAEQTVQGTATTQEPDVDKFREIVQTVAQSFLRAGPRNRSNVEQIAKADSEDWRRTSGQQAQDTPARGDDLAAGVAVSQGHLPGVQRAQIESLEAQAGQRDAAADAADALTRQREAATGATDALTNLRNRTQPGARGGTGGGRIAADPTIVEDGKNYRANLGVLQRNVISLRNNVATSFGEAKKANEAKLSVAEAALAQAQRGAPRQGGGGAPQLDMAAAAAVKADLMAGKITRDQALAKLRVLGFK